MESADFPKLQNFKKVKLDPNLFWPQKVVNFDHSGGSGSALGDAEFLNNSRCAKPDRFIITTK